MTQTQPVIRNFTDFFKDARDIYVQNNSEYQISLSFKTQSGDTLSFLLPKGLDPVNLTQTIPFDLIKESADFRRMVNRRPKVMSVLTEEEYNAYFEAKAKRLGKSVDALMDATAQRHQTLQQKLAPPPDPKAVEAFDASQTDPHNLVIKDEDVIHPRVLHLMQQVSPDLTDTQKMTAAALLEELEVILPGLNDDSLEMVRARGYWKSVKAWAARAQTERASQHEGDG